MEKLLQDIQQELQETQQRLQESERERKEQELRLKETQQRLQDSERKEQVMQNLLSVMDLDAVVTKEDGKTTTALIEFCTQGRLAEVKLLL